ncbi:hypothetical protein DI383_01715 [Flavobacteriaceae bacterium LYZ1037]|nr:hypothetical protein DI383_01715 [Flavobacteriaceae bacterium LYZ1037]
MKNIFKTLVILISIATLSSCSNDDDDGLIYINPDEVKTYTLTSVSDPTISGTAKFIKNTDNSVTIELQLTGTSPGGVHPAHIHKNTAAEGGDIALTLGTVDGDTGFSTISTTSFTFEELLDYDGYINVHVSDTDLGTLIAQGDIGQNELTGTNKIYALGSVSDPNISGTVEFAERVNGETMAKIQLDGTPAGGMHPAHIHMNTAAETGDIAYTFNPVNGDTGMSVNNISVLDFGDLDSSNDVPITYDELTAYDGYVNVHLSALDLVTLVAQGDIGQNELTGMTQSYTLNAVDVPTISGTVTFSERSNGDALAKIELTGTPPAGMHPAHIHMGSVATAPGDIMFTFNPVIGDTGISLTNVTALDDTTSFGYSDILNVDGYINVHLSASDLGTLVAQGNIGANN